MAEADVVLLEARRYEEWQPLVEAGVFDTVYVSDPLEPCRGKDSALILLRRRFQRGTESDSNSSISKR